MRKILTIGLFILIVLPAAMAQNIENGAYQGFKIDGRKPDAIPDIIDIHVNSLSGGVSNFSDSDKKPLNGHYHIIIHSAKYITANIARGILEGEWRIFSHNNIVERGFFKKGSYDGELHKFYSEHEIYKFDNGKILHYIAYHPNGNLKIERRYENGQLHGRVIEYDEDGELRSEVGYLYGKIDGKRIEVVKTNGKVNNITTSHYNSGILEGEYLALYGNNNIREKGSYDAEGKKTGKWITGNEDGTLHEEAGYLQGKYHGERLRYRNGKPSYFEEYAYGRLNGKYIWYDDKYPSVREEKSYKDGHLDGVTKYYYDGTLQREYIYREGDVIVEKSYIPDNGYTESFYQITKTSTGRDSYSKSSRIAKMKVYAKNGKLQSLSLLNEKGDMVVVQEYDTSSGKVTKTNKEYKKHSSIKLKEDEFGIIDIELE